MPHARVACGGATGVTDREVRGEGVTVAAVEGSVSSIALALPFEVASVWHARRRLAMDLRTAGVDDEHIEDAVLVLSELFGNALRHARPLPPGMARVAWGRVPEGIEISVTD